MVYVSGGNELLDPLDILARVGIKTGDKVGDLGCGRAGHFAIPAARMVGDKTVVYAVDILKNVLQSVLSKARIEGIKNLRPIWSDLETVGATNILGNSLDVALLINILFQSKNWQKILQESSRLLKTGGKLLVVDWNQNMATFGPPPQNRIKADDIKKAAASLKFTLVDEFEAGTYHYGLIFTKQ